MKRVLVVEDNPDIAELLALSLAGLECRVRVAASLKSGLLALSEEWPDLVLLDIRLPDGSGYTLLEALDAQVNDSEARDRPSVVVVSAYATAEQVAEGMAAGADTYVTKPFAPAFLKEVVGGFLDMQPDHGSLTA